MEKTTDVAKSFNCNFVRNGSILSSLWQQQQLDKAMAKSFRLVVNTFRFQTSPTPIPQMFNDGRLAITIATGFVVIPINYI